MEAAEYLFSSIGVGDSACNREENAPQRNDLRVKVSRPRRSQLWRVNPNPNMTKDALLFHFRTFHASYDTSGGVTAERFQQLATKQLSRVKACRKFLRSLRLREHVDDLLRLGSRIDGYSLEGALLVSTASHSR